MSFAAFMAIVLGVNLVCAVVSAFIARRWGRDPFSWVLVGAVLGPFGLVALIALRPGAARRPSAPLQPAAVVPGAGNRILLPVDGSEESLAAVRHVAEAIAENLADVLLLTVLPIERGEGVSGGPESPRRREIEEEARSHLGRAEGLLRSAGMACRTEVRFGDPAEEILKAADGGEFDFIVIGRRGRGLSRALLGSVSDRVAKNARTPVTVVG